MSDPDLSKLSALLHEEKSRCFRSGVEMDVADVMAAVRKWLNDCVRAQCMRERWRQDGSAVDYCTLGLGHDGPCEYR